MSSTMLDCPAHPEVPSTGYFGQSQRNREMRHLRGSGTRARLRCGVLARGQVSLCFRVPTIAGGEPVPYGRVKHFYAEFMPVLPQPKVLLVVVDQWRGHDQGWTGRSPVRTPPNLDRLAYEGVAVPNTVANSRVCAPSRVTMLTARLPIQHGLIANDVTLDPVGHFGLVAGWNEHEWALHPDRPRLLETNDKPEAVM